MSNLRQTPSPNSNQYPKQEPNPKRDIILRSNSVGFFTGHLYPARSWKDWHQLVYASKGVITVRTDSGIWVVPPQRAVLVPAEQTAEIQLHGDVSMRSLFFLAAESPAWPADCRVISVPPLLRELILHIVETGVLSQGVAREKRLVDLVNDLLQTIEVASLVLLLPHDYRLARAFATMERSPACSASLVQLARTLGTTRKTLDRAAQAEMGISLGRWRDQVRMYLGLRMLAEGHSVSRVAIELGYASASAFIVGFRRHFAVTPGAYFQGGYPNFTAVP